MDLIHCRRVAREACALDGMAIVGVDFEVHEGTSVWT